MLLKVSCLAGHTNAESQVQNTRPQEQRRATPHPAGRRPSAQAPNGLQSDGGELLGRGIQHYYARMPAFSAFLGLLSATANTADKRQPTRAQAVVCPETRFQGRRYGAELQAAPETTT